MSNNALAAPVNSFSVVRRNYGHWDITTPSKGRIFRLRGAPGQYRLYDDREDRDVNIAQLTFQSTQAAMSYVCDQLMTELIITEGQEPAVIKRWNITE